MPNLVEDSKTTGDHSGLLVSIFGFRRFVRFLALLSLWISGMAMSPHLAARPPAASGQAQCWDWPSLPGH
jgi:hypothetical protein